MTDQTKFTETQEHLQQPPVEPPTPKELVKIEKAKKIRKKTFLISAAIFTVLILAAVAISMMQPETQTFVSEPSPTPTTQQETLLQKELNSLKEQIDAANPQDIEFPPPPIDMEVSL